MITYEIGNAKECFDEISRLFQDHYSEISLLKEYDLRPDYAKYFSIHQQENLKVILCKDEEKIIGYIVFFIGKHLHYIDCLLASEDIYYLKPEYRKGRTGIKMFKYAEQYLKSIDVKMIRYGTKVHSDNSALFEYLGYSLTEKVYTKMLKD
jgi:GNAT superfamily N-acetyltransferase